MVPSLSPSLAALAVFFSSSVLAQASLPQVDLGYEIHQALSFNETGQTYNFSNIRFAQPPVGALRFAAPVAPTGRNTEVQNGSQGVICPQIYPLWGDISFEFLSYVAAGNETTFNTTLAEEELAAALENAPPTEPDPRTTEDCLFLDVVVPKAIFDGAQTPHRYKKRQTAGAPVLVWIYGGGYVIGDKGLYGNPSGLIAASQAGGGDGIIFVAINYRLGALGWLAGPSLQAAGGVSNAGLYDQRLALEWVQKNIHLFGGDPNQVTVMGQSAGAGSIEHQITAYGGQKPVHFQRAIAQSPGFAPVTSLFTQENTTQTFLSLLNVSTIEEARNASSAAVIQANTIQVATQPYGSFAYGPVVDGIFVPALPGLLLNAGQFAKNVSVMVSHMYDEGPEFTPPNVRTDDELAAFIRSRFPGVANESLDYMINTLYPADYNGSQPYSNGVQRTILFVTEFAFSCNTNYLNRAFDNQTYAYHFLVPPGFHGFDVPYTFYNNQGTNLSQFLIAPIAQALQGYLTNFVQTGDPNGPGLPTFPRQGDNATVLALNATYIRPERDDTVNERCAWFQKALYT